MKIFTFPVINMSIETKMHAIRRHTRTDKQSSPPPPATALTSRVFDSEIMRANDLTSIVPRDFVSVVVFRVVRGGDHDSPASPQFEDGVGNPRSRNHLRKQIHANPRMQKNGCSAQGETVRVVSAVVSFDKRFAKYEIYKMGTI